MAFEFIPLYKEGVDTTKIKPTECWDKVDLDDKGEVMSYILECGKFCCNYDMAIFRCTYLFRP